MNGCSIKMVGQSINGKLFLRWKFFDNFFKWKKQFTLRDFDIKNDYTSALDTSNSWKLRYVLITRYVLIARYVPITSANAQTGAHVQITSIHKQGALAQAPAQLRTASLQRHRRSGSERTCSWGCDALCAKHTWNCTHDTRFIENKYIIWHCKLLKNKNMPEATDVCNISFTWNWNNNYFCNNLYLMFGLNPSLPAPTALLIKSWSPLNAEKQPSFQIINRPWSSIESLGSCTPIILVAPFWKYVGEFI